MNSKNEKMEKVAKKAEKKAVKKAVKSQVKAKYSSVSHMAVRESPYLKTILDPVNFVGVKIPDEITTPSFTAQVLTKFVITSTTGAGGNTGAGFARTLGSSSGGYVSFAPSATAQQYAGSSNANPWAVQFNSQCASYRLVSAKATMTYLGSPNNASGRFLIAFISPYNLLTYTGSGNLALSGVGAGQNLLQNDKLVDVPASKLYSEVRYVPLDAIARSYETSGSSAYGTLRPVASSYGQFVGILDGCPASQSIEVNVWENYECIPQTNLVNLVNPTPSLSDPLEMSAAANVLSSVPTVSTMQSLPDVIGGTAQTSPGESGVGNSATSSKVPTVTESSEAPFMDKLMKGAGSLLDAGKKAVPLVAEIAAML